MNARDAIVDLVAPLACEVGENPLWHPEAETLFFLDITLGTIYAYHPATEHCSVAAQTRITGGFTLQRDGSLLLGLLVCPPEKKAAKLASSNEQDTFSGPV
jgi:sugar lactone lactonase YvrE